MLLPLRLRLRSSSTRQYKHYPFPKPYSHNPWYKKWGQVTQIDTARIDAVIEGIASLQKQLAEATEFIDNLQKQTVAVGEEEPHKERFEQAVQLTVRVIATLSSIDSRIEQFKTRLLETQKNVQELKIKTVKWIWIVTITVATLIIWMAAGQVALCCLAWRSLHS